MEVGEEADHTAGSGTMWPAAADEILRDKADSFCPPLTPNPNASTPFWVDVAETVRHYGLGNPTPMDCYTRWIQIAGGAEGDQPLQRRPPGPPADVQHRPPVLLPGGALATLAAAYADADDDASPGGGPRSLQPAPAAPVVTRRPRTPRRRRLHVQPAGALAVLADAAAADVASPGGGHLPPPTPAAPAPMGSRRRRTPSRRRNVQPPPALAADATTTNKEKKVLASKGVGSEKTRLSGQKKYKELKMERARAGEKVKALELALSSVKGTLQKMDADMEDMESSVKRSGMTRCRS